MDMMQALVDGMSAQWKEERAQTQMTLGKFISALAEMPQDAPIDGVRDLHSYRGYYSDLAFEPPQENAPKLTVADTLAMCRAAMGQVFQGYKGGDYMMGANTPLWIANYGHCGLKLMGVNPDGTLITAADD